MGRFLDPITYGEYPASMRALVGKRLPKFTPEQVKLVKGSMDFLGMNYYTTYYAAPKLSVNTVNLSYTTDNHLDLTRKYNSISTHYYIIIQCNYQYLF